MNVLRCRALGILCLPQWITCFDETCFDHHMRGTIIAAYMNIEIKTIHFQTGTLLYRECTGHTRTRTHLQRTYIEGEEPSGQCGNFPERLEKHWSINSRDAEHSEKS